MDLVELYTQDCGGRDNINETTRNHIRRIAYLQCVLEDCEAQYVKTGVSSLEDRLEYQRLANSQSRLMAKIGLLMAPDPKTDDDDEDDDTALDPLSYASGIPRQRMKKRPG